MQHHAEPLNVPFTAENAARPWLAPRTLCVTMIAMSSPLPLTHQEMLNRGWGSVDVVFVTGDAYVDHPSFAAALLARVLEAEGLRVSILAQPDWRFAGNKGLHSKNSRENK